MVTAANMTNKSNAIFAVGEVLSGTYYPTAKIKDGGVGVRAIAKLKLQREANQANDNGQGESVDGRATLVIPAAEADLEEQKGEIKIGATRYAIKGMIASNPLVKRYRLGTSRTQSVRTVNAHISSTQKSSAPS